MSEEQEKLLEKALENLNAACMEDTGINENLNIGEAIESIREIFRAQEQEEEIV